MDDKMEMTDDGGGPGHHIRRVADSTLVVIMARLMAAIGVPAAGLVMVWLLGTVQSLNGSVIEMKTALLVGIEPRVARLESEIETIRASVSTQSGGWFDRADAKVMEERLRREIDQILAALSEMRAKLDQQR